MFKLSKKSLSRMQGIDPELHLVVTRAIHLTEVDFSVVQGLRTQIQQDELYRQGLSQVKFSKHQLGKAVDLQPWVNGSSDDIDHYIAVAEGMRIAACECGIAIRSGLAWQCHDIRNYSIREIHEEYIKFRGDEAFIDGPHFELS